MPPALVKAAVRAHFTMMSRRRATRQIERIAGGYRRLAETVDAATGSQAVRVPKMPGIDEDMRDWTFFMVLEHNVIVNRSITSIIGSLVRGETPKGAGAIDPKRGVMPSDAPGVEQIDAFAESVADHLDVVSGFKRLRRSSVHRHPVFGNFNAHQWHCMFGFHLRVHYRQAEYTAGGPQRAPVDTP